MTLEFEMDGRARRAAVWLPDDFDPEHRWPLLLWLHAYEERGDDCEHLAVGIGPALEACSELYRCIVVMPQCPSDSVWSVVDRPWAVGQKDAGEHIDRALDAALVRFPIDPDRVVLSGASMGGYGTFVYGARRADRFRAFGPLCGGGIPAEAAAFVDRPVWVWHGTEDDVVPPTESRAMVDAIRGSGVRYTEVAGHGHDVWDVAYRDREFATFLSSA